MLGRDFVLNRCNVIFFIMGLTACYRQPASGSESANPCDSIHVELSLLDLGKAKNFVAKGVNSNETIAALKDINGVSIADLEAFMMPGIDSQVGFLSADESLLQLLANDNACVLDELKTTHQELADRIFDFRKKNHFDYGTQKINYQGIPYEVKYERSKGYQDSPFKDGAKGSEDISIKNLKNGASISFGELNLNMAYRYGFYEGKKVAYRLDPFMIDKVFPRI